MKLPVDGRGKYGVASGGGGGGDGVGGWSSF